MRPGLDLGIVRGLQEKRAALVNGLSDGAKHQAFPKVYATPIPRPTTGEQFAIERQALDAENKRLRAEISMLKLEIAAMKIVAPPPPPEPPAPPGIPDVMAAFCKALNMVGHRLDGNAYTMDDLKSQRRGRAITQPRHVAMWLCRRICKQASLPKIGVHFGQRDHTSIMHGCSRATDWMDAVPTLRGAADIVLEMLETKGTTP